MTRARCEGRMGRPEMPGVRAENSPFPRENGDVPGENRRFRGRNGHFPWENAPFPYCNCGAIVYCCLGSSAGSAARTVSPTLGDTRWPPRRRAKKSAKKSAGSPPAGPTARKPRKKSAKKSHASEAERGVHEADAARRARSATSSATTPIPRTEVTKKLWAYIKRNGLQDTKNRRMINADDNLRRLRRQDPGHRCST